MVTALAIFLWGEVVRIVFLIYVNHVPLSAMRQREVPTVGETGWVIVILVVPALLLIGGLVFGLLAYRCPACEKIPVRSLAGDAVPDLNPTECPHCKARLGQG